MRSLLVSLFLFTSLVWTPEGILANETNGDGATRKVYIDIVGEKHLLHGDGRDEQLLRALYGPDWKESVAFRTASAVQSNSQIGERLDELQAIRSNPEMVFNIVYNPSSKINVGETLDFYASGEWIEHVVSEGDTVESIAAQYGLSVHDLRNFNRHRFEEGAAAQCSSNNIVIPANHSDSLGGPLNGVIIHEAAHLSDSMINGFKHGDYGKELGHEINEVTTERGAWIEGWSEYNQALVDERTRSDIQSGAGILFRDHPSAFSAIPEATHEDFLSKEGTIANILLKIDGGDASRRSQILRTMTAINDDLAQESTTNSSADEKSRIHRFLDKYIELNPEEANDVISIYDGCTGYTCSREYLEEHFGKQAAEYIANREKLAELYSDYRNRLNWGGVSFPHISLSAFLENIEEAGGWRNAPDNFTMPVKTQNASGVLDDLDILDVESDDLGDSQTL